MVAAILWNREFHEDRENPKVNGSERVRADKIVRDYLSVEDHEETVDTFPMIGLPNDISRTDRAVRQAFESALKLMIQSFEQAANGSTQTRRTNALAIAALCVGEWFCLGRSRTANWQMNCAAPPRQQRSS
jgi:hypothetical protein